MADIEKLISIAGDSQGFAAALDEAENQARQSAAKFEEIDKLLKQRLDERDAAFAQKQKARGDAVLRSNLDARIKMLDKETDQLLRALNKQQADVERAEARITKVRDTASTQRIKIAEKEAVAQARAQQSVVQGAFQGFARSAAQGTGVPLPFIGGGIGGIAGALVGAAAGMAIKKAVTDTLEYTHAIVDLNLVTQAGIEKTSQFAAAAERFGVDADKLGDALRNMMSDISQTPERWEAMGIAIKDAAGNAREPLAIFADFRAKFSGAAQSADTLRAAQEILGRSYGDLLPLLRASDSEFAAIMDTVLGTSRVLSTDGVQANLEYEQSLKSVEIGFANLTGTIGQVVIPMLSTLMNVLGQTFDAFGTFLHNIGQGQGIGDAYGGAIADSQNRAADAAERARKMAADAIASVNNRGGGVSLPTRGGLGDASRAANDALQERVKSIREESQARIEAAQDALKAFERERDAALRTIQDEEKARARQHQAELDAIDAETNAREDAYRARERQRDDATAGLKEELRLLDEVTSAEKSRTDLADAEADLAAERNVEVFRSASQTEEQYRSATDAQRRRVIEAEKKVADQKKAITKDTARAEIEARIRAIEKERELDTRALQDYKQGAEDRVRTIRDEMSLERAGADARLQQIRDEMDAERMRVSDLIEQEQRATREIIAELDKRRAAAAVGAGGGGGGGGGGGTVVLGGGGTTTVAVGGGGQDLNQRRGEWSGGGLNLNDARALKESLLGRPASIEEAAGYVGRTRESVTAEIRGSVEYRSRMGLNAFGGGGDAMLTHDYPHSMTLSEPTLMVGMRSGRSYGVAAARGDEDVTFGGVGERSGVTITGNTFNVREEADIARIARELDRLAQRRASHGFGRLR